MWVCLHEIGQPHVPVVAGGSCSVAVPQRRLGTVCVPAHGRIFECISLWPSFSHSSFCQWRSALFYQAAGLTYLKARELVNMSRMSLALVVGWITIVSGLMQFINPPPFGSTGDFSNSETYTIGSTVNIAWTPAESGKAASLVLYQLDSEGVWFGDMEYLTRKLS
jgi:hypothetical protein